MNSSYAPPGESANDLWLEKSNLDGLILSGAAYGILFTLAWQCLQALLKNVRQGKTNWRLVAYVFAMLCLATIGFGGNTKFIEMTYITDRNFPGGPNGFTAGEYAASVNVMSFASYVVMSWLADGLVLSRYHLIWDFNRYMLIGPCLIYGGAIAMSISLLVSLTQQPGSFWSNQAVNFSISYWSLSIALNVILTVLIVVRLLTSRQAVRKVLGKDHAQMYTSLAALLVESASLYSITGLIFIITYARGSYVQNLILPPLGQIQGIAPLLIILRLAEGRAWNRETIELASKTPLRSVGASQGLGTQPESDANSIAKSILETK